MRKTLAQAIFEYRACDKTQIRKTADHIASVMLEPLVGSQGISPIDKELLADVFTSLESYCLQAPLDRERLGRLLDCLSLKLLGKARRSLPDNPIRASDIHHIHAIKTLFEYVVNEVTETSEPSIEQSLEWLTLFLITASGACFKEIADAAVEKILGQEMPVEFIGQFHVLQIFYRKGSHFSNAKDIDNNPVTERLLFLAPLAFAALTGFRNRFVKNNCEPLMAKSAFKILKPLMERSPNSATLKKLSERQFFNAAAQLMVMHPSNGMPYWLRFYADGSSQSSSMTLSSFKSLVNGSVKPVQKVELRDVEVKSIEKRPKPKEKSKIPTPSKVPFFVQLLEAAKCPKTQIYRSKHETKARLKSLLTVERCSAEEIFIEWILYELEDGTWNASSSVTRTIYSVGPAWIFACGDIDLTLLDIDEVTHIYEEIIKLRKGLDSSVTTNALKLLRFASEHFSIALPDALQANKSKTMVVNTLPSEVHFEQLLDDIDYCFKSETPDIREAIKLMMILLRRLFLRPYEVVGVRIKDICINDIESSVFIRRNPSIFIKTHSAVRQLPAHLLLKQEELELLRKFIKKRKNLTAGNKDRLLFSTDHRLDMPFSTSTITQPITRLLSSYLGEHTPCYQLRHAGISALELALWGNDDLIEQLTPFSVKQAKDIRKWLTRSGQYDMLFQLSSIAGHLSPSITLSTYAHHSDILLYQSCCNIDTQYQLDFWCHLSGLRPSTLLKNTSSESSGGHFKGSDIIKALERRQFSKSRRDEIVKHSKSENKKFSFTSYEYHPKDCETVLHAFDKSPDTYLEIVNEHGVEAAWASNVITAAQGIKQHKRYVTRRGQKSRLYPNDSGKLAPPEPQSKRERVLVTTIWKDLNNISQSPDSWNELRKCIDYLFRNTSQSRSGTTFSRTFRKMLIAYHFRENNVVHIARDK